MTNAIFQRIAIMILGFIIRTHYEDHEKNYEQQIVTPIQRCIIESRHILFLVWCYDRVRFLLHKRTDFFTEINARYLVGDLVRAVISRLIVDPAGGTPLRQIKNNGIMFLGAFILHVQEQFLRALFF